MVLKCRSLREIIGKKPNKPEVEKHPEPRIVNVQKVMEDGSVRIVGEIMSNTCLGLNMGVFTVRRFYLGIRFFEPLNQYVLIHTNVSDNDGYAIVVSDEKALQAIIEKGKTEILNEPEFKRLRKANSVSIVSENSN